MSDREEPICIKKAPNNAYKAIIKPNQTGEKILDVRENIFVRIKEKHNITNSNLK